MKTVVSKTKKSKVSAVQPSKATPGPVSQQVREISRPNGTITPSHEAVAERAYEIYLQKGCQPFQCEQNWLQAEQELKNQD